jgi:hypothetical protein
MLHNRVAQTGPNVYGREKIAVLKNGVAGSRDGQTGVTH